MRSQMVHVGILALAAVMMGGCASSSHGPNEEEKITMDKAPQAVRSTVGRLAGANDVHSLTREVENGQTVYEAEWKQGAIEHSAVVSAKGDVMEEETEMNSSDLPAAVKDAVKKKYPGGKLGEAGSLKEGGRSGYEVEVYSGNEKHELKVSSNGEILSDKVEHETDHEKNDKD